MNCDDCLALLDRHPSEVLPAARQQELEHHLAHCPACRADRRFLPRLLTDTAALPAEITPGRDLWPGIAGRLGSAEPSPGPTRPVWLRLPVLATAAVLLIILSAAVTTLLSRQSSPPLQASAQIRQMEQAYEAAADELLQALEANRTVLGPRAAASVEQSLRELDAAITEARRALDAHPGSLELAGFLRDSYQQKIDLLQRSALGREGS